MLLFISVRFLVPLRRSELTACPNFVVFIDSVEISVAQRGRYEIRFELLSTVVSGHPLQHCAVVVRLRSQTIVFKDPRAVSLRTVVVARLKHLQPDLRVFKTLNHDIVLLSHKLALRVDWPDKCVHWRFGTNIAGLQRYDPVIAGPGRNFARDEVYLCRLHGGRDAPVKRLLHGGGRLARLARNSVT